MRLISQLRKATSIAMAGGARTTVSKVVGSLRRGGMRDLLQILGNIWGSSAPPPSIELRNDYRVWVEEYDTLTETKRLQLELALRDLTVRPKFSVLMPTYNTRREWLVEAIESVRSQIYPNWELCIADDASQEPHVADVLRSYAQRDPRIRFLLRPENGHISATSNSALEMAGGDWVALLDHDDTLAPDALFWVAKAINEHPGARMVYSDEDKIDESGSRLGAYFKPDWNPDLFLSQNMFSHLGVFRTDLVRSVGGFRIGLEGSQDYDLTLRCIEKVARDVIVHVPRILYHWRIHGESTAMSNEAKPYAISAAEAAIEQHLRRQGINATCMRAGPGYRVTYSVGPPSPRVALLISGERRGPDGAPACARDVLAITNYPEVQVFVVSGSTITTSDDRITLVPGSTARQRKTAAMQQILAGGFDLVCLVDSAIRPAGSEWLRELVSHGVRPSVGAVGPKIISRNDTIESGGIVFLPGHPLRPKDAHQGLSREAMGYGGRAQLTQQMSAVRSDCIMLRTDICTKVGLSELKRDSGIALCAKIRAQGLDVVWTPFSEVVAELPLPPLPRSASFAALRGQDPAYNPNLYAGAADFSLSWPPRLAWPSTSVQQ